MARPLSPHGSTFGIGITGHNFDPAELAEPEKVKKFIQEETGRTDLQFGEFTWLSYFKYASPSFWPLYGLLNVLKAKYEDSQ